MADTKDPSEYTINDLKAQQQILENQKERTKAEDEILERVKNQVSYLEKIIDYQKIQSKIDEERIKDMKAAFDLEDNLVKKLDLKQKIKKEEFELSQKEYILAKRRGDLSPEELQKLKERYEQTKSAYETEVKLTEAREKGVKALKDAAGYLKDMSGTYGQQLITQFTSVSGLFKTIGGFVTEIIDSQQKLVAQTGKVDLFNPKQFEQSRNELARFGFSMQDLTKTMGVLDAEYSNFSNLNEKTRHQIADLTTKNILLGISQAEQGKIYKEMTRGIGLSSIETSAAIERIKISATQLGVAPQKAIADLGASMSQLSSHGKNMEKVFNQLMKQSKELGMEISQMLGIIGKSFDTFEGAADKAGKFNAILGGDYLNSVQMLNATESERIEIMREAFRQSGKNFDTMDRFEKKAIANALGLKDEAEARKLLVGLSAEEQLKLKDKEEAEKKLNEAMEKAIPMERELKMLMSELAVVAMPLVERFRELVGWIKENRDTVGTLLKVFVYGTLVVKSFQMVFGGFAAITQMLGLFSGGLNTTAAATSAISRAYSQLGAGLAKLGSGIGNAFTAMASGVARGLSAIGNAVSNPKVIVGLAVVTLVLIGIAFAFKLVLDGVSGLIGKFASLKSGNYDQVIGAIAKTIGILAIAFIVLGGAMLLAGMFAKASAGGILIVVGTVVALAFAIKIATAGIGYMFGKMAEFFKEMTSEKVNLLYGIAGGFLAISAAMAFNIFGTNKFVSAMESVKDAIYKLPTETAFTTRVAILKDIGSAIEIVTKASPEKMKPAKDFVDSSTNYMKAQKESKDSDKDALVQALKQVVTIATAEAGGTKQGGLEGKSTIIINLQDAKITGTVMKSKLNEVGIP